MKNLYLSLFILFSFSLTAQNTVVDIIVNSDDHNVLEAAVLAADLAGTLSGDGPFTVFAPTDDAFAALPDGFVDALLADPDGVLTQILLHHVVGSTALSTDLTDGAFVTTLANRDVIVAINDDGVFIDNAKVTVADLEADNGVVHVIDAVLDYRTTIFEAVEASSAHNTLEAAIVAAGLQDALNSVGPLTLFGPVDDAFAALPDGTLDVLLADPTGALTDILLYHVVAGDIKSTDLSDGQMAETLNGQDIEVTINTDGVFINTDVQVIQADIGVDNGVIHAIDGILLPITTSTKEVNDFASVNVFPNPAQEIFTLNLNLLESDQVQVRIVDMKGMVVDAYANVKSDQIFDIRGYTNGMYLIEINNNGNRFFKKLIIKK